MGWYAIRVVEIGLVFVRCERKRKEGAGGIRRAEEIGGKCCRGREVGGSTVRPAS